jgi:hypothetical protein
VNSVPLLRLGRRMSTKTGRMEFNSLERKGKTNFKNKMFTLLNHMKISGIDVKFSRCDGSGENKSFFDSCRANGHIIKFEFSGPRTPQRNGKMERKFQTF